MNSTLRRFVAAVMLALIFLLGMFIAFTVNSDFGRLEVKTVLIADGNKELSGLLYRPGFASAVNPVPGVVLAHGIGSSKEMMSGVGLELARRDFVVLCLDLFGHGGSDGSVAEGADEPSFGVSSAVQYLRSQSFVNASAIGLVGHSLGAGAVRATFASDSGIGASVLIAGGLGEMVEGSAYGVLNSTFPKNLLVIVGRYDVLFNLTQVEAEELVPAFGAEQAVVPGVLYGGFSSETARKLVTPATTHLFEPVDPLVVSEVVSWMEDAFKPEQVLVARINVGQTYLWREFAILVSIVAFFGVVFLGFFPLAYVARLRLRGVVKGEHAILRDWEMFAVWGVLGLALFLPMVSVGLAVNFPPLIFGASIAWWALAVGVVGFLVLIGFLLRSYKVRVNLRAVFVEAFDKKYVFVAVVLFILMVVVVSVLDGVFNVDLRIVSPMFRAFTSVRRVVVFFGFLPFFLVYFLVEGLYFHGFHDWVGQKQGSLFDLLSCCKVVFGKVVPFVAVICLQYVPVVVFDVWVFPSFVGFLVEFLWLIVPIFIITTVCSWWFYRNSGSVWCGAVLNALMMAWVASTVFPF